MADNGEAVPSRRLLTRSTSYIPYGEIFVEESSTGWQSPYYFNSKELDEETGLYYYGARYLNPTEARWLSVDPMWEKYVGMSPYNYCAGNPVKFVDVDGRFSINVEDNSISKEQFERFESIVQNIGDLFKIGNKWDVDKLKELSNITGINVEDVKEDLAYNQGPTIFIREGNGNCYARDKEIVIDAKVVEALSNVDFSKKTKNGYKELSRIALGVAMLVLHEYGHYGDQQTNGGYNTGQFIPTTKQNYADINWGDSSFSKNKKEGNQFYKMSKSGHRGDDVTQIFGVKSVNFAEQMKIETSNSNQYLKNEFILSKLKISK